MVSRVTGHSVWIIKYIFANYDITMTIASFFSLSCTSLCFSSNYCVLLIARYEQYITERPIPVAGNLSVGLRPFACWDWGFKCNRGDGCLSVVSVVCCQVAVSASGHCPEGSCSVCCV